MPDTYMRKENKNTPPEVLRLMQSLLWTNDKYKIFFSKHHTNNPQEYYCFFLDIASGLRKHGRYKLTTECAMVEFLKTEYKVKYLANMRTYDIFLIQLTNTKNELDYHNWMGYPLPVEKGKSYTISVDTQQKYL